MPKSKRQTRKVSARDTAEVASSNGNGARSAGGSLYDREFNPDYSQTIMDLKRIAILAASFIGLLLVLTIFLR